MPVRPRHQPFTEVVNFHDDGHAASISARTSAVGLSSANHASSEPIPHPHRQRPHEVESKRKMPFGSVRYCADS